MNICKGCGREIFWGKSFQTGKLIPLEKCKHIYRSMDDPDGRNPDMVDHLKDEDLFISHFLTCPQRNQFTKANYRKEGTD